MNRVEKKLEISAAKSEKEGADAGEPGAWLLAGGGVGTGPEIAS